MCGIAGFQLSTTERKDINSRLLAQHLLLAIEHRGTDATGAAWVDPTLNRHQVQKAPQAARDFVSRLVLAKRAPSAILHTRQATQGMPQQNENNHPIVVDGVVGVHNGIVYNDNTVMADLKAGVGAPRVAEVDSEALFAAVAYGSQPKADGQPMYGISDTDALEKVSAAAAIAYYHTDTPEILNLARLESNPLIMAQTVGGSFLFGSETEVLTGVAEAMNLAIDWLSIAEEGMFFQVRDGRIITEQSFKPMRYVSQSHYNPTNRYGRGMYGSYGGYTPKDYGLDEYDFHSTGELVEDALELSKANHPSNFTKNEPTIPWVDVDQNIFWERLPITDRHLQTHPTRAEEVDITLDYLQSEMNSGHMTWEQAEEVALESHAFLSLGAEVQLELGNVHRAGYIVQMPDDLKPDSTYLIQVPFSDNKGRVEYALVSRVGYEFDTMDVGAMYDWLDEAQIEASGHLDYGQPEPVKELVKALTPANAGTLDGEKQNETNNTALHPA